MTMWHTASGIIVFDPPRPKMKRRTEWWAVVNVFDKNGDLTRYYRWWFEKTWGVVLYPPSHGTHVSIIRGEPPKPELLHLWKERNGEITQFKYSHYVEQKKGFFFCIVDAPHLMDIRRNFGFPTNYPLHLTIGKAYP